jgi:hypothetical protein
MGWDWHLRTAASMDLLFFPRCFAMWTIVWWYWLRLSPNLSTRALWQPPVLPGSPDIRYISGASGTVCEGNENLVYLSPWDFKRSFTCCKILWHGTSSFTSLLKEGVLRIFIAFKNAPPWPGSNPQPLAPMENTLTTTPPRRQWQIGILNMARWLYVNF